MIFSKSHMHNPLPFQLLIYMMEADGIQNENNSEKGLTMHLHTRKIHMGIGGWLSVGACLLVGALSLFTLLSYAPELGEQRCPLAGSANCNMEELGDILAEMGMPMR